MSYDDWKTTDTTEPDPQCDMCGGAFRLDELDDNNLCASCERSEQEYADMCDDWARRHDPID